MAYDARRRQINRLANCGDAPDLISSNLDNLLWGRPLSAFHRILIDLFTLSRLEQHYLFSLKPRGDQ